MTTKQERTMQLVRAAQLGDEQACTALYQETRPRVNSLCVRFDPLEAEDLAQTAWIQIFQKLKTFRGDSLFSTWVHRLVVNHCPKLVSRVEPREADVSQMQVMAKEDYVGKYGAITTKGMHSETQQLWERMQELRFEDVLIIPCPKGMDVQKYRAKLGVSVQRLIRMNKPAYKCTLGANVARNWVVLLKQKLETMAATV